LTIIDFIRIELTLISLASSLTKAPLACLCVVIHTSPLLALWPHSFSYKIKEKIWHIYPKIETKSSHQDM